MAQRISRSRDTFVLLEPKRIVEALVGLKIVQVLAYQRTGPDVELLIDQVEVVPFCRSCDHRIAAGLDETSLVKLRTQRSREYVTTVTDVAHHQLLKILPTRDFKDAKCWVHSQPGSWKGKIRVGALVMSAVYSVTLLKAQQVVEAVHCVQLANRALDDVRRRVRRGAFSLNPRGP